MKKLEEIINQEPVFMNEWKHVVDMVGDFEEIYLKYNEYVAKESHYSNPTIWLEKKLKMDRVLEEYKNINILFMSYGNENCIGEGWVLFEEDGNLYEVNGSHCSCYGLKGQWNPELVNVKGLEHRLLKGTWGEDDWSGNTFKEELCKFLGVDYVKNA